MQYISKYKSPLGDVVLAADETGLTGIYFECQKGFEFCLREGRERQLPIFDETKEWLNIYFSGKEPRFKPPLHFTGTAFQNEVWGILCSIEYGKTVTYGEIARKISERRGIKRMSAQAVGGAVGKNKISIIVPCHRVIGTNGGIVGYSGGIDKKIALLELERKK